MRLCTLGKGTYKRNKAKRVDYDAFITDRWWKILSLFLWIVLNSFKVKESVSGDSLLLTSNSPGIHCVCFVDSGLMESWTDSGTFQQTWKLSFC